MSLVDKIIYYYGIITPLQTTMVIAALFLYVLYLFMRDRDAPPGPRGLPLFGYWPFLKPDTCHVQLHELTKKYGDVYSLRIGGELYIHLGSIKSVKEAHMTKSDCFGDRFSEALFGFIFNGGVGLVNGEQWHVLRKFFVSKFKEYGMNAVRENAATAVYDTLKETVDELNKIEGRPIEIAPLITMKCMANIRRIMFNDQGISIEELTELNDQFGEMIKGLTSNNMILSGKFAKYFIGPFLPYMNVMKKCNNRIEEILHNVINRHKSEYKDSHIADLIDSFFREKEDRRKKGDPTAKHFTDEALLKSLSQFLTDGVLTVGVFIGNFLMTVVENPDIQNKIYDEIVEVIGTNRFPALEDKANLQYTNAFINEVTRYTDFFPLFPGMRCRKETTVQGHKIPVGAMTLVNIYGAHRNPKDFENPYEFNPSRYLASPGKPRADLPILFGLGKRACIGEAFAMIQTFLFLTTIVQNFKLVIPGISQGSTSMFCSKEKLKICAYPRSQKSH